MLPVTMHDLDFRHIDALVADLRHGCPERRTATAMKLLRFGEEAVLPVVRSLDLIDHGHDKTAVSVLKQLGRVAAVPVAALLAKGTLHERRQAARALRELGPDALPAVDAVVAAISEPDQDRGVVVRLFGVIRQLGPDAADHAVPVLVELLSRETWTTWSAGLLGSLGRHASAAVVALVDLAEVGDSAASQAARRALARVSPKGLSGVGKPQDGGGKATAPVAGDVHGRP